MAMSLTATHRMWVGPTSHQSASLCSLLQCSQEELVANRRRSASARLIQEEALDVSRAKPRLISDDTSDLRVARTNDSETADRSGCVPRARERILLPFSLANITPSAATPAVVGPPEENEELRALLEIKERAAQSSSPSDSVTSYRRSVAQQRSRSVMAGVGRVTSTPSRKLRRKRAQSPHNWPQMQSVLRRARDAGQVTDHTWHVLSAAFEAAASGQLVSPSDASTASSPESFPSNPRRSETDLSTPARCNLDDDDRFLKDEGQEAVYTPWHCQPRASPRRAVGPYHDSDAMQREVGYRRSLLHESRANGVGVGVVGRNPFDRVVDGEHVQPSTRRELMPLRLRTDLPSGDCVYRDVSMPGVTEWVLKRSERIFGHENPDAPVAVLRKSITAIASPQGTEAVGADLYKRLVRALDQRVPSAQRLLGGGAGTKGNRKKQRSPSSSGSSRGKSYPVWMRAAASKLAYGHGSDIFSARYETRLSDFDPDRRLPDGEIL